MISTVSGYTGGDRDGPTYHSLGNHTEAVMVVYDPARVSYPELLKVFWSAHDPYGNTNWTQYRNAVFTTDAAQQAAVAASIQELESHSEQPVSTHVEAAGPFFAAEDYHQKYLLRQQTHLYRELRHMLPTEAEFLASTAAARINGYLGGNGSAEQLRREIGTFGLSPGAQSELMTAVGVVVR